MTQPCCHDVNSADRSHLHVPQRPTTTFTVECVIMCAPGPQLVHAVRRGRASVAPDVRMIDVEAPVARHSDRRSRSISTNSGEVPMPHLSRTLSRQIVARTPRHRHRRAAERRRYRPARSIRRLVTDGFARSVCTKACYRVATSPDTFESRCVAACLADPERGDHRRSRRRPVGLPPRLRVAIADRARRTRSNAARARCPAPPDQLPADPRDIVIATGRHSACQPAASVVRLRPRPRRRTFRAAHGVGARSSCHVFRRCGDQART